MMSNRGSALTKALVLMALLAAAGAGVFFWTQSKKAGPTYRTTPVERGDIIQAVTATGSLNPVTNVQVGSQISGIITNLNIDFNTLVKKGQIVAQIDASSYSATISQSEGDLSNALASLELAELDANRAAELFKADLIPKADSDKAIATLHQAQAQVKIKQAALEKSKIDLDRCTIYAPVDGVVISRNVDIGQTVAASLSAPTICVIANDLSQMQIDAYVSEADIGGVEKGQSVTFTVDAFAYRTFRGKVKLVRNSPITNQNVISYDTVIEVNNDDLKLLPGMTANVRIITAQTANALKLPNAALRFRPQGATNAPLASAAGAQGGGFGSRGDRSGGPGGPGGGGPGSGFGPRGDRAGGPGGAGGSRGGGPRAAARTIYTLSSTNETGEVVEIKPKQIRTGISDGIYTEVTDGLAEGDLVVTGSVVDASSPAAASAAGAPAGNPFGGGRGGRF